MAGYYRFHATGLVADGLDRHGISYQVMTSENTERVRVGFAVKNGPMAVMNFISTDDDNDVRVRVYNLITDVSRERRARVRDACDTINKKMRFLKFYLDDEDCVDIEYDFLMATPDDSLGEMAVEILYRAKSILDDEYPIFGRALYSDDELDESDLIKEIDAWRSTMDSAGGDSEGGAAGDSDGNPGGDAAGRDGGESVMAASRPAPQAERRRSVFETVHGDAMEYAARERAAGAAAGGQTAMARQAAESNSVAIKRSHARRSRTAVDRAMSAAMILLAVATLCAALLLGL